MRAYPPQSPLAIFLNAGNCSRVMRFARRARSRFPDEAGNDETGAGKKTTAPHRRSGVDGRGHPAALDFSYLWHIETSRREFLKSSLSLHLMRQAHLRSFV